MDLCLLVLKKKNAIKEFIDNLIDGEISINDAIEKGIENKFLVPNESYESYLESNQAFLKKIF